MAESESEAEADKYVDRRWSLPKRLWDQVLELAASSGINYAELVCILLEDGLKVRMRIPVESSRPDPPPAPWTVVRVELEGDVLGRINMRQVPSVDEIVTVDGKSYVVLQRAWTVVKGEVSAWLRVGSFS